MKRNFWMFMVLFLVVGTVAFAQEDGDNGTEDIVDPFWYYKLEILVGFQMGFSMTNDANLIIRPTIVAGFRHYLKPVFRSLILGYSVFANFAFSSELDWKSPEGEFIGIKRGNLDSLWGYGGLLGVSLQGRMFGPVSIVLDAGIIGNNEGGRGNYAWTSKYQGNNFYYQRIDLGLGANGGIFVDFGRFSVEVGANLGYSFFRWDSYELYDSGNSSDKSDSDSKAGVASIIRVAPYIMIGFKW